MRALLSVWDKTGLVELATGLRTHGVELVASGGTAAALRDAGIEHLEVADVTGFPEMLDGRVKTLHPRLHAGILADRSKPEHLAALAAHDITAIDLVVSNLYPFSSDPSIELIDIGGPSMVRAAAKNHEHVAVLTSPSQYDAVLDELDLDRHACPTRRATRWRARPSRTPRPTTRRSSRGSTAAGPSGETPSDVDAVVPSTLHLTLERASVVRYGENPHQIGARYRLAGTTPWWDGVTQHAGSALSYLNLFDADAAWRLVHELASDVPGQCAVAIIKHANASGAAVGATFADAFQKALAGRFAECLRRDHRGRRRTRRHAGVADRRGTSGRRHHRVVDRARRDRHPREASQGHAAAQCSVARAAGSFGSHVRRHGLVQNADELLVPVSEWKCVTTATPTEQQLQDLVIAWRVCARTTSNAIVIARDGVAVGIGAGQQSRVVSANIATTKAGAVRRGRGRGVGRVLPLRRRTRVADQRRRRRGRATGRLGARPRGDRRGERRRDRDDAHR